MTAALNPVFHGQRFRLLTGAMRTVLQYRKRSRNGKLVFVNEATGGRVSIASTSFNERREANEIIKESDGPLFPLKSEFALLDEYEPGVSRTQRRKIIAARKKINRRMTLRFYLVRADQDSVPSSLLPLRDHIARYSPEAERHGYLWVPSASHLKLAARSFGTRGDRRVEYFLSDKHERSSKFDGIRSFVDKMIAEYWNCSWEYHDAHAFLAGKILEENDRRSALRSRRPKKSKHPIDERDLPCPVYETVRLWIRASQTPERLAKKFSERQANRATRGRGEHFNASFPLQTVAYDFTQIDIWCNVLNSKGTKIGTARPYLLIFIDIYTRMIVAAYLSFEPPSVYTLCEGVKQMLRPKAEFAAKYGACPATDGWGRPSNLCGDNGVEGTGISFDMACDVARIDHFLAPISNPEFKSIVERIFRSMNRGLWRKGPGGIRYKPSEAATREHKPRKEAAWSIEDANDVMWLWIYLYHHKKHRGINMPPAMAWEAGIKDVERQTLQPDRLIDRLFGKRKRVWVTAQGVRVAGERFTEPDVMTEILQCSANDRLERDQPAEGEMNSYRVRGTVVEHLEDCSYISIYHPGRQQYVTLANVDKTVEPGTSWIKRRADLAERNRQIRQSTSGTDVIRRGAELADRLRGKAPEGKPARRVMREEAFERMQLVKGASVNVVMVQPSIHGQGAGAVLDVETMKDHTLEPPPMGRGPTRDTVDKARRTREQRAVVESRSDHDPADESATVDFSAFTIGDANSYFADRKGV